MCVYTYLHMYTALPKIEVSTFWGPMGNSATEEGETLATTPYGINPSENRSPCAVQT